MTSPSRNLDPEKRADLRTDASDNLHAEPAVRTRRNHLNWLALAALTLLVLANCRLVFFWTSPSSSLTVVAPSHPKPVDHKTGVISGGRHNGVEPPPTYKRQDTTTSSAAARPTVLECFQVAPPVLMPQGATYQATESGGSEVFLDAGGQVSGPSCSVLLMEHSFAWSYGMPFIGKLLAVPNSTVSWISVSHKPPQDPTLHRLAPSTA